MRSHRPTQAYLASPDFTRGFVRLVAMSARDPPGAAIEDGAGRFRRALAQSHRGLPASLPALHAALEDAVATNDPQRILSAAGACLVVGQDFGSFRGFPGLLALLAPLREATTGWDGPADELVAWAGFVAGLNYYGPSDPAVDRAAERIMALLERDVDVNLRFAAGRIVLYYAEPRENRALSQRVYALLHPAMDDPALEPYRLARFLSFWSRCARFAKDNAQAERAERQVSELVEKHGLRPIRFELAMIAIERAQPSGNLADGDARVAEIEALADPANPGDQLRLSFMHCRLARARGDGERALFHAIRATQYARELELPPPMLAVYLVNEAQSRLAGDNVPAALVGLREASALVPGAYADEVRDMIGIVEAYDDLRARRPGAHARMAAAWAAMRERQFYDTFDGYPEFGARMCVVALEEGIETDFVAALIRMRGIAPPHDAPENWPWPLRVHTLGGFRLEHDGIPLAVEGKSQKKPLELLKALVALGGQGVPKARLQELLWPDGDPAAAGATLDMTISRLRKLLGVADAIRVEDGKIMLDPRKVWVDAFVFDRDVDAAQSALKSGDAAAVRAAGERLLARYRGPFLGAEEPYRWSLATRDRLHHRFLRSLAAIARFHAGRGAHAEAIACYGRALEEDSLAEELYRDLMRCQLERGEPAEAARVYRRCREMLSIQLGIPPSAETESLFRSIYAQ